MREALGHLVKERKKFIRTSGNAVKERKRCSFRNKFLGNVFMMVRKPTFLSFLTAFPSLTIYIFNRRVPNFFIILSFSLPSPTTKWIEDLGKGRKRERKKK